MYSDTKTTRLVADAVTKIMMGEKALHPNQQKLDVHEPEKDELTADDFKKLRAGKKTPEVKKEEVGLDEVSLKTATSAYVKRMGDDGPNEKSSQDKATKTMDLIAKKHGVRGVARAAKTVDDKYGLNDPVHNPRKAFVKQTMANVKKEEVELTKEEAEMLASLSQEEFNSLTEEEQDLFIEYFQPLDEISTGAAKNYLKKAVPSSSKLNQKSAKPGEDKASESDYMDMDAPYETKEFQKFSKRRTGIRKAITKLASAHPDNKKLATTARQAFNKIHNANYRIGMDGAKNTPNDVKHVKQQHSIIHKAVNAMKEAAEQIEEMEIVKTATGMRVYGSSYGDSAKARRDQVKRPVDDVKGPKMKELSDIEAEKKKKKKMSEMVALYQEQGLKGLFASLVKEEPDNEQFTKELEAQKAKNAGQGKKAEVAKAEVLAVQEEEFEVVMNEPNGYAEATIEERSMTEPEIKKKEEIVKSMKKGISGFKDRYGDRAKNVMYATATKRAMGEEVEQIEEGTPEGYQRRDGKLIPKIHPTMTPHEHGYDYTMQSIEDAPSKAKIHSQHKEIVKDNPHPQGSKEHKDWEAGTNKAKADHLKDFS
jgi:hypothetical protein